MFFDLDGLRGKGVSDLLDVIKVFISRRPVRIGKTEVGCVTRDFSAMGTRNNPN